MDNQDDWNDGYWLEAMDRCSTISVMIDELLIKHPGVLRTPDGEQMIEECLRKVQKLYQAIGLAEYECNPPQPPLNRVLREDGGIGNCPKCGYIVT